MAQETGPRPASKNGVDDGDRTHDRRNHNPVLYQLSYAHHWSCFPVSDGPRIVQHFMQYEYR